MIPIARPVMGEPEAAAARRAILSGWITQGPEVEAFEAEFARSVGAEFACAVSSCTTALHLALLVAGVEPGDEVITVSHSYIATANSIRYCGALPVFVDIEPAGYNMDPSLLEAARTERTRAVLCVHQMGMPCDLPAILAFARRHGLPLIEDAACAAGSEILWQGQWQPIGRPHGDAACFSFHPRKVMSTGDGGMLTTNNAEYDRLFRLWRQHSMSVNDRVRHSSNQVIFEEYPMVGYNYRMTDIQAAVGDEQLKRMPGILARRRELAAVYDEAFRGHPVIATPAKPPRTEWNVQSYIVRLRGFDAARRDGVMQTLLDGGIASRAGVMASHREPAYAARGVRLPVTEAASDGSLVLPLHGGLSEKDIGTVAAALRAAVA